MIYSQKGPDREIREIGEGRTYLPTYNAERSLALLRMSAHDGGASERASERNVLPTRHPPQPRRGSGGLRSEEGWESAAAMRLVSQRGGCIGSTHPTVQVA
eukprot:6212177-Pleurochrysis_carterae.AAC.2